MSRWRVTFHKATLTGAPKEKHFTVRANSQTEAVLAGRDLLKVTLRRSADYMLANVDELETFEPSPLSPLRDKLREEIAATGDC